RRPLLDAASVDGLLARCAELWPAELEALERRAEALAAGETPVLHHVLRGRPTGEDWHRDFVSRCAWPVKFHGRYAYAELLDAGRPSDVKVPWELSRLQGLPALALAHRLRALHHPGAGQHRDAVLADLASWRAANPPGYGVNWTVGMEVALRAVSLVFTADLLGLDEPDIAVLLAQHGRFLARNLEYSDINGNHYTACLLGLLVLGMALPGEREADRWLETAGAELGREILAQTHPDGVCHEGSIPYHRLVLELFLVAALVARRGGVDLGAYYHQRLGRMLEVTAAYPRPDHLAPVWGDDDDGRVLRLTGRPVHDHRGLLAAGGALLGRGDLVRAAGPDGVSLDALLPGGGELAAAVGELLAGGAPEPQEAGAGRGSAAFPHGGFYVLRRDGDYCFVDCGDVGLRGRGGHGHNDALSCEVALAGVPVLTDTGCASYTRSRDGRVHTLSALSHNVPVVAGREPAPLSFDRFPHATACPVELVAWDPGGGVFSGRHLGYARQGVAGAVERRIELAGPGVLAIADRIDAPALDEGPPDRAVEVAWHFQLAEAWQPAGEGEGWLQWRDGDGRLLRLDHRLRPGGPGVRVEQLTVPRFPGYGLARERWRLVLTVREALPVEGRFRWSLQ
ncbi:MAG TPA: heparinase II/III family protein, partial [Thermoanaerobaculia bacterium]|nr:heparinase II/III family protein [Thermoanaerobaculia bacterium]